MGTLSVPVHPDHLEAIDPGTLTQLAQLAIQEAAAIKAKNWGAAIMIGLQIAGLIATLIPAPTPTPPPVPPAK